MENPKNFSKGTVSTGYNSAATSIVLNTGDGAKMPATPFDFVWWDSTTYPDPSDDPNVEVARCSALSGDTLTIARAKQGTAAANHNTGGKTYKVLTGITARTVDDIRTVYPNGAPFWNAQHVSVMKEAFAFSTGENDVYTVPTGRKAIVLTLQGYNNSGTTPTVIAKMKVSGTYYRAGAGTSFTSGTNTTVRTAIPLEAGDSLSLNFSAGITANMAIKILEFDAQTPVKFVRILGTLANGDNTVYTCPAGYSAAPLTQLDISGSTSTGVGPITFFNDTGGSRTIKLNLVPSGSSVGSGNFIIPTQSATNAAVTAMQATFALNAGDAISLNVDTTNAAMGLYAFIFESPLPE